MKTAKTSRQTKGLGLCSGGLDSMLSALLLKQQGIDVTWICFQTPFFSARSAKKASDQTGIPLIVKDITADYMKMMRHPKAGFGKNMNPCMDCHALMFEKAGQLMHKQGFDFLFSGEVLGQRPKSQNRNSLRYVEKNSRFDGHILRPLCAKCLPETDVEKKGLVNRSLLMDISGRSRKPQMALAQQFGVKEYPSPAGGCLLTDKGFSNRLKDLMDRHDNIEPRFLYMLKSGRHFRIDDTTKVVVGRNRHDNRHLMQHADKNRDILIRHEHLPGPDVVVTGHFTKNNIITACEICAAYTKAAPGKTTKVRVTRDGEHKVIQVTTPDRQTFGSMMI